MKNLNKIWGIGLLAFMLILFAPQKSAAQQEGEYISDQEFYDALQPYGTWVSDPQYGNVWVPDVEEDFRPYATRGYWALTSYGNTWVSDYPWGWATFHYGRWRFDDYYGWEWVPGNEWAPAWVSWRDGGGYYGWAPMSPGVSIDMSFGNGGYDIPDNYWVFAPQQYITYPNIYNYYVPHNRIVNIIHRTTYIRNRYVYNNRTYITGPRRDEIQRYTTRPVRVYHVNNVNRPSAVVVNKNTVNIYRPAVRRSDNARPARVVDGSQYKQQNPAQRIGGIDSRRGTVYNRTNAAKLAEVAKTGTPNPNVVKVNNDRNNTANLANSRPVRRSGDNNADQPARTAPAQQQQQAREQQQQQIREQRTQQQQQAREQQQQQTREQRTQQQQQVREQQQQQTREQRTQQQQQVREQQQQQTREQRTQQQQQAREQQQQQAKEQQRQQQQQAREQQQQQAKEQQRQQQQQAREQQQQQAKEQQQQAREQQQQQAKEQQRQQQQQAREQQQQQQAKEQQRQQQQQAREQQQQAKEQQRQQQQQAREQQRQQQPAHRPARP